MLSGFTTYTKETNEPRNLWEMLDVFIPQIVVMVTWMFAYVQTHRAVIPQ